MNPLLLLSWWNLIYLVPFGLALVYVAVYTVSGVTFGDADGDVHVDVDADADVGVDADVHADVHVEVSAEVSADADADGDADGDAEGHAETALAPHPAGGRGLATAGRGTLMIEMLQLLGLGRVPLSLMLMVLCISWGAIGFCVNTLLWPVVQAGWLMALISIPVAAVASLFSTAFIVRLVSRFMPTTETYVRARAELVGQSGEALYDITGEFGLVAVRDAQHDLFQVPARVPQERPTIAKGSSVVLFEYDADKGVFYVAPFEAAATQRKKTDAR